MTELDRPWVVDNPLSRRYPVYTRGNVEEVTPDVSSPLQWSAFAGTVSESAWRQALVEFGAFEEDEFREEVLDIQGVFHGYIYINLSIQWVYGVRMPGADPEAMSRVYLGDRAGAVTYQPRTGDAAPHLSERIQQSMKRAFEEDPRPRLREDAVIAQEVRGERGDLSIQSDEELLARHRRVIDEFYHPVLVNHFLLVYQSSLASGLLDSVVAPLGDPTLNVRLLGGWGEVASAAPSIALWDLGRTVLASPQLTEEFDRGPTGLAQRMAASTEPSVCDFWAAFTEFSHKFGSRSTSEYEAMPETWETHPAIPLGMIDRLRLQSQGNDPRPKIAALAEQRVALAQQIREQLADEPEQAQTFDLAMRMIEWYMPAREQSKTNMVRLLHEARLPIREIAQRRVSAGFLEKPEDLSMLTLDEVREFVKDPTPWAEVIDDRWEWRAQLQALVPPYIVDGEVPPPSTWQHKQAATYVVAQPGEILSGVGACPGHSTGRARIIEDAADARDLEPGEILVAPETDPGWTPLFLSAAGVVVNAGNQLSHAAIVSRELGIPAVLGVEGASKRITDGMLITVDGTAGTVTIHE